MLHIYENRASVRSARLVKERYRQEDKNLLKFRIENGFYNVYEGRKMTKRA